MSSDAIAPNPTAGRASCKVGARQQSVLLSVRWYRPGAIESRAELSAAGRRVAHFLE
jgi:hypothetical protein